MGTPFIAGGVSIHESHEPASIWKPKDQTTSARTRLPRENPFFPETKHTLRRIPPARSSAPGRSAHSAARAPSRKTVHNITQFGVTPKPGRESWDCSKASRTTLPPRTAAERSNPPRGRAAQLIDKQYPLTSVTTKEVYIQPSTGVFQPWATVFAE